MQLYWDGHYKDAILGSVYDVIAVPLVIQVLAATGAWLGADSVRNALLEASRAEDLAAAKGQIQEQTRAFELQRYRLQQGVASSRPSTPPSPAASGTPAPPSPTVNCSPSPSASTSCSTASPASRVSDQRARVDAASHDLAIALRRLRAGQPYTPPNYTGTPFDEVLVELARLRALPAPNAARVTGLNLGGPSLPPRSLPAPASQPERPFPFGPAAPAAPRYDPAAFANPPSNIPGAIPSSSTIDSFLQPGRMTLPPTLNPAQQPNNSVFDGGPIVPPQPGPIASPGDAWRSRLTLPPSLPETAEDWPRSRHLSHARAWPRLHRPARVAPSPGHQCHRQTAQLPSGSGANTPIANDFSTDGVPAEDFSATHSAPNNPAELNDLSASDLIQPTDLPPWLRGTAGADAPAPPADDDDATASHLPPWLQNIQ